MNHVYKYGIVDSDQTKEAVGFMRVIYFIFLEHILHG